jgi:hypothetical protein
VAANSIRPGANCFAAAELWGVSHEIPPVAVNQDFKPFEVIKMANPRRYQQLKLIGRFNGTLVILLFSGGMLATLGGLAKGRMSLWEFLVHEIVLGVALFYVVRWWRWAWRKD